MRIGETAIKLYNNSSQDFYRVEGGERVEIRHLRRAEYHGFTFYISSLFTSIYINPKDRKDTGFENFDGSIVEYAEPSGHHCTNAVGYLPLLSSTLAEYEEGGKRGLGVLSLGGKAMDYDSPCNAYIRKEHCYSPNILKLRELLYQVSTDLCIDELRRFIFHGKVVSVNAEKEPTDVIVTYSEDNREREQESITLGVADDEEEIEVLITTNSLTNQGSLLSSLHSFTGLEGSISECFEYIMHTQSYFVVDCIRVDEERVVNVGVRMVKSM